jgi:3-ketosteroid 9alpha-monooxygenase subunit A
LPRTDRTAEIYTVTDLVSTITGDAGVKVPFTWKVTGWFMVGWSPEFPIGGVRPLHYFGEDLVAYRDEHAELHVLEAHCKHLGAHIGHGGKVVGDCVECAFHGWRWARR